QCPIRMLYFPTGHGCDPSAGRILQNAPHTLVRSRFFMFDHAFHRRVDAILAALRAADRATPALAGSCLDALRSCLREAEVPDHCIGHLWDLVLDRVHQAEPMTGAAFAEELGALLDDTPG